MNIKIQKGQNTNFLPIEELHQLNLQHPIYHQINLKKSQPSKVISKNYSKYLYYYQSQNRNLKTNPNFSLTGPNLPPHLKAQQTLNQQLLNFEKPKPQTSDYRSGRKAYNQPNLYQLNSNKISLRSSSKYNRLSSVAGIPLNENQAQQRLQNFIITKQNQRKNNRKQIQKENKKNSSRLNSQQSQYSTKKLLKDYEQKQKISKRLTESKMSKRSNQSVDHRSVDNQSPSRASVLSKSSKDSCAISIKSTSRLKSSDSLRSNQNKRLQAKLQPKKKIKIVEYNINSMNQDELTKFRNLFANSFNSKTNSTNYPQNQNQILHHHKLLLNNGPSVDIEVLSQKSETSTKKQKTLKSAFIHDINNSNKKLKQLSFDKEHQQCKDALKINKNSNFITSDGLLHRIAEEMYSTKNNDSKGHLIQRAINSRKKASSSSNKTTNPQAQHEKLKTQLLRTANKKLGKRGQLKSSVIPCTQIFSTKF